ncbi:hypothetical protein DFQ27_007220 [Actinomortierella ambigua]|uniref:Uncharacterized protein n=1 Tax=Actinomortierella ambigua TaxID=1343610 RepID=A0A9P6QIY5_9FUNG|nr:hypothetical protein DFQ27_007220 [Actinomortierella ambigua]
MVQKVLHTNRKLFIYDSHSNAWHNNAKNSSPAGPSTPNKMPSFQSSQTFTDLGSTTTATTTNATPTQSSSSLSFISSYAGSSLTTGLMQKVSTWRAGDDSDEEASLDLNSNRYSYGYHSFPSQASRESSSQGGSMLRGIEITPTLAHLQFPQIPIHTDDSYYNHLQSSSSTIMPPPTQLPRRLSSPTSRSNLARIKRPSEDDGTGDQFVPSAHRNMPSMGSVDRSMMGSRPQNSTKRYSGGMAMAGPKKSPEMHDFDQQQLLLQAQSQVQAHDDIHSGFPSPQSTINPSPRVHPHYDFASGQPSPLQNPPAVQPNNIHRSGSAPRLPASSGRSTEALLERRRSQSVSMQSRPPTPRVEGRYRRRDASQEHDEPMRPPPRLWKDDPRLNDLGASLEKSLSFNGDDDQDELERRQTTPRPFIQTVSSSRHQQQPSQQQLQHLHNAQRQTALPQGSTSRPGRAALRASRFEPYADRKGKARVLNEEDEELVGKTPVLLSALNATQTNILAEIKNTREENTNQLNLFRDEIYASLQVAFTSLSNQVEGVGRAVVETESAHQDGRTQVTNHVGAMLSDMFTKLSEVMQAQLQQSQPRQGGSGSSSGGGGHPSPSPYHVQHSQSVPPPSSHHPLHGYLGAHPAQQHPSSHPYGGIAQPGPRLASSLPLNITTHNLSNGHGSNFSGPSSSPGSGYAPFGMNASPSPRLRPRSGFDGSGHAGDGVREGHYGAAYSGGGGGHVPVKREPPYVEDAEDEEESYGRGKRRADHKAGYSPRRSGAGGRDY